MHLLFLSSIKSEKPIKPKVTISIASDSATVTQPIPALAASLQHSKRPNEILFGYGDKHFMIFEHLEPNFNEKMQVLVRGDPKKLYTKKPGSNKDQGSLKILTPIINTEDVYYKSALTVPKKNLKSIEMPMESRLQNLNLNAPAGTTVTPQAQSKVQLLVQSLHSKDATYVCNYILYIFAPHFTLDFMFQTLTFRFMYKRYQNHPVDTAKTTCTICWYISE